jgi:hypothetical protein
MELGAPPPGGALLLGRDAGEKARHDTGKAHASPAPAAAADRFL